jgi:superfamily II DNA/RNA helicase
LGAVAVKKQVAHVIIATPFRVLDIGVSIDR